MSRTKKETEKNEETSRRKRRKGVRLGVHHSKLSVPDGLIPSHKVGRWINDVDNRIHLALESDYEFVTSTVDTHIGGGTNDGNSDIGSKISKVVGSTKSGEPMRAYLMMIDRDWYEEDQGEKQKRNDDIDEQISNPGYGADQKGLAKSSMYGKMTYKS